MRLHHWISPRIARGMVVLFALAVSGGLLALVEAKSPGLTAQAQPKLEASIFSYDGTDFVRSQTTLMTADGKSAVGTKLEHNTPAYKALSQKHSYSGEATAFGKKYDANYAPLMGADGKLTGALFVGIPK